MSYPLKNREDNNKYRFFKRAFYIFIILVLVSIVFPNITKVVFRGLAVPFLSFNNNTLTDNNIESAFRTKTGLLALNKKLQNDNAELLLENSTFAKLEEENNKMREILNSSSSKEIIFAEVLASPPVSFYDTLVISNPNQNMTIGAEVVSYNNMPIGTISDVSSTSALVRLHSSAGNSFQVVFDNNTDAVEIFGMGGGFFKVRIPKNLEVSEGSNVYFRGTSKLVGIVKRIEESPSDSFKEVFIQSPVNIFQIEFVLVKI